MNKTVKKISFTALFAAMVFGLTMLHIPIGAGGYIHVGDAMIYLSGLLLGPWAFLAASIGAAFSDLASGVATYAIPSAIIKFLIAIPLVSLYSFSKSLQICFESLIFAKKSNNIKLFSIISFLGNLRLFFTIINVSNSSFVFSALGNCMLIIYSDSKFVNAI